MRLPWPDQGVNYALKQLFFVITVTFFENGYKDSNDRNNEEEKPKSKPLTFLELSSMDGDSVFRGIGSIVRLFRCHCPKPDSS